MPRSVYGPLMTEPSTLMAPDDTGTSPEVIIIMVLLPHPLGPRIEMNSPLFAANETSFTTWSLDTSSPKYLLTFSNAMSGLSDAARGAFKLRPPTFGSRRRRGSGEPGLGHDVVFSGLRITS